MKAVMLQGGGCRKGLSFFFQFFQTAFNGKKKGEYAGKDNAKHPYNYVKLKPAQHKLRRNALRKTNGGVN